MFSNKSLGAKYRADGWMPKKPILIVPGLCSSCLKVVDSPYSDWVGKRIWLSMSSIGFGKVWDAMPLFGRKKKKLSSSSTSTVADVDANEKRKWIQHMCLKDDGISDPEGIKLRPVKGVKGCAYLDPGAITNALSYVFGPFAEMLEDAGYIEEINLSAIPYDWRLPPHYMEERDGYFSEMQRIIEKMVKDNGAKVVIIAHSLGNRVTQYFVRWVEKKMGRKWASEYIDTWIALGPLWLGSPKLLRAMVTGDRMGLEAFLFPEEGITLGRSLGSSAWMFPYVSYLHEFQSYCQVFNKKTKKFEPKSNEEILCESGAEVVWEKFKRYYDNHELWGPLSEILKPPPVDKIYAIYGINLRTETFFFFKKAKNMKSGAIHQLDPNGSVANLKCEGGIGYETKDTKQNILKGKPRAGDGTVPYASLAYCKKWSKDINIRISEIEGAEHREILKNKTMWQLVLEYVMQSPPPTELPITFQNAMYNTNMMLKGKRVSKTITLNKSGIAFPGKNESIVTYDKISNIDLDDNHTTFHVEVETLQAPLEFDSANAEEIVNDLAARCRYVQEMHASYKEERNEYGQTALHVAVLDNSVDLIIHLIKTGSDLNAVDMQGNTPLLTGAECGNLKAILILLQAGNEIDVTHNSNNNTSVIHKMVCISIEPDDRSSFQQWCAIMKILKQRGANLNGKIGDTFGDTPMHLAVKRSHEYAIQWLAENGGNVNIGNNLDETPLHYAVRSGQVKIVQLLLNLGATRHKESKQGETPLAMAKKTNQEVFNLMQSFNAATPVGVLKTSVSDFAGTDEYGQTPLHKAAFEDRLDTVFEILQSEDDHEQVNQVDKNGWSPLHSAAANGNIEVLLVLLSVHGVDVNQQTTNGTTILHYLARKRFEINSKKASDNYIDVLNKLRDKGVRVNLKAKRGIAPMHDAALYGNVEGATWLLLNQAKVNVMTDSQDTPLHFAIRSGKFDMVKLLLDYDADVSIKSLIDGTPLELANQTNFTQAAELINRTLTQPRRASRKVSRTDRKTALLTMQSSSKKSLLSMTPPPVAPRNFKNLSQNTLTELTGSVDSDEDDEEEEIYMKDTDNETDFVPLRERRATITRDRTQTTSIFQKSDGLRSSKESAINPYPSVPPRANRGAFDSPKRVLPQSQSPQMKPRVQSPLATSATEIPRRPAPPRGYTPPNRGQSQSPHPGAAPRNTATPPPPTTPSAPPTRGSPQNSPLKTTRGGPVRGQGTPPPPRGGMRASETMRGHPTPPRGGMRSSESPARGQAAVPPRGTGSPLPAQTGRGGRGMPLVAPPAQPPPRGHASQPPPAGGGPNPSTGNLPLPTPSSPPTNHASLTIATRERPVLRKPKVLSPKPDK